MAIQNKITAEQYKALLMRSLDRPPAAEQSSVLSQLQPPPGMPIPEAAAPGGIGLGAPIDPMAQTMPMAEAAPAQQPAMSYEAIAKAEQTWGKLRGTAGEQLWSRIAQITPELSGMRPDSAFITAATKFLRDPNSIADDRVKQFLGATLGSQQTQPTATPTAQPDISAQLAQVWR